jgi:DNA-binding NarL/FixJ family response regulator
MAQIPKDTDIIILAAAALSRAAWQALLAQQPGLNVWGTASDFSDLAVLTKPDGAAAILLDFPELSLELVQQITTAVPTYGLLALVDEYALSQIVSLLQAGAVGILSRNATVPELSRGLIAAERGEIVLPPALAARALAALARGEIHAPQSTETLTEREQGVLTLLAQGRTNKDIAQSLFLSVRTIEAHLRNIYSKLDVTTRTEAVLWAVQHGFES